MRHTIWLGVALLACALLSPEVLAQSAPEVNYTVYFRARPAGQEVVSLSQTADGWLVRGANRLAPPMDVVTRAAEIHYDREWRPTRLSMEGMSRGQQVSVQTTFANGQAASTISVNGESQEKTDAVSADAVVMPNGFLGSYVALARRLVGQKPGATIRAYIAPQAEVPMRIDRVEAERIETPKEAVPVTRFTLIVTNPPPGGDMPMNVWVDAAGGLLRFSVPAQGLDVAREDVASAVTRTSAFSLPGDESVRIPATGFNLAANVTKPRTGAGPFPALVLIGGSGPTDRDGFAAGIPVIGQIAGHLADAGFLVVRYDKRGVGQSGGRIETATLNDYAEDVRSIVTWLSKDRKDVDDDRISLVGHSEGAWVAMIAASRDRRIDAVALVAGAGTTGSDLILEQQRHLLEQLKSPAEERQAKIDLQTRINQAALKGGSWDGIPDQVRSAADTPWFQSFLAFDPARVMRDVRQPVLVVQAERDTQVPTHHGDRLAELARARNRKVPTEIVKIPGVNHLLVPATTGEVSEYPTLTDRNVSTNATAAIAKFMTANMK